MKSKLIESILTNAGIDRDKIEKILLKKIKENNELDSPIKTNNEIETNDVDNDSVVNNNCICPVCDEECDKKDFYEHMMVIHYNIFAPYVDNKRPDLAAPITPSVEMQLEANESKEDILNKHKKLISKKDVILTDIETMKRKLDLAKKENNKKDVESLNAIISNKNKEYDEIKNEIKNVEKLILHNNIMKLKAKDLVKEDNVISDEIKKTYAEKPVNTIDQNKNDDEIKSPNVLLANVKKDLNELMSKLLKKSVENRNEDSKSAQDAQDLADVIKDLLMHLEKGTIEEFKKAQNLTMSLWSGMNYKLPDSFWSFISEYKFKNEDTDKNSLKNYFNIIKAKETK